jgi:hypothetical protein
MEGLDPTMSWQPVLTRCYILLEKMIISRKISEASHSGLSNISFIIYKKNSSTSLCYSKMKEIVLVLKN